MCERQDRLKNLIEDFMKDDERLASSADEKCQKVYDHLKILVQEKEELKNQMTGIEDKTRIKELKAQVHQIDEETNKLLDLLSRHSMNF